MADGHHFEKSPYFNNGVTDDHDVWRVDTNWSY